MTNYNMTLIEAIKARHSVRHYIDKPLPAEIVAELEAEIAKANAKAGLHIQLVREEPKSFNCLINYGQFSGVRNYFVVAGKKSDHLDEDAGYHGEKLVLLSQMLGLNTCWVGVNYSKIEGTYQLNADEKIVCYIGLGYGNDPGRKHRIKAIEEVSNCSDSTPEWFRRGVEAALLAPTAVNQQKFYFEYCGESDGKGLVRAKKTFSMIGYTALDLGIAKCHFEIGAGAENFNYCQR